MSDRIEELPDGLISVYSETLNHSYVFTRSVAEDAGLIARQRDAIDDLVDWQLAQHERDNPKTRTCPQCRARWTGGAVECPECGVVQ